jgi:hypothetical protein
MTKTADGKIADGKSFKIESELSPGATLVRISGQINEEVDFNEILSYLKTLDGSPRGLELDVHEISQINSCGVRSWLTFLEKAQPQYQISFRRVGETFIEQASIVPSMLGPSSTPIGEFDAPFYCPKCSKRFVKPLKIQDVKVTGDQYTYPKFKCESCGSATEFDALEEEYFNFLRRSS